MNPAQNNVEFEEEKRDMGERKRLLYSRIEPSNIQPKIIQFLIRRHIVRNEAQADLLLVVLLVACIAASIFIFTYSSGTVDVTKSAVLKVMLKQ
jgi:hypothetical protein